MAALAEMYVQGVSTRKVKAITEELCGHSFSASTISAINKGFDPGEQRGLSRCGVRGLRRPCRAEKAVGEVLLEAVWRRCYVHF